LVRQTLSEGLLGPYKDHGIRILISPSHKQKTQTVVILHLKQGSSYRALVNKLVCGERPRLLSLLWLLLRNFRRFTLHCM